MRLSSCNTDKFQFVQLKATTSCLFTSAFSNLLKANGLRHIRFHDLRHTCASLLLNKGKQNGVTLKDIQVWLGHSDFSTTANIYSHLDANSKISSLDTLSGVVNI